VVAISPLQPAIDILIFSAILSVWYEKIFYFCFGPLWTFGGSLERQESDKFNGAFQYAWEWVLLAGETTALNRGSSEIQNLQ